MADPSPAVLERLRQQRHQLVHKVLWVAMGIVTVAFVLNALMLGRDFLAPGTLVANLLNFALIGAALWLNHRRHMHTAVWLIIGVTLLSLALSLLQSGISGNLLQLFVYFIPVAIAERPPDGGTLAA